MPSMAVQTRNPACDRLIAREETRLHLQPLTNVTLPPLSTVEVPLPAALKPCSGFALDLRPRL